MLFCARHKQSLHTQLCDKRQEGSTADVSVCSLTLFLSPLHKFLFTNSAGVKGHEVINCNSLLAAVSEERLFLSTNELRFEAWSMFFLKLNFLTRDCRGFCYCVTLVGLRDKMETKDKAGKTPRSSLTLTK